MNKLLIALPLFLATSVFAAEQMTKYDAKPGSIHAGRHVVGARLDGGKHHHWRDDGTWL